MHQHLDDGHKARNEDDIARDAHLIGDHVAKCGDDRIGADENCRCRHTHANRIRSAGRHREGGTSAEDQNENGIFSDDTFE